MYQQQSFSSHRFPGVSYKYVQSPYHAFEYLSSHDYYLVTESAPATPPAQRIYVQCHAISQEDFDRWYAIVTSQSVSQSILAPREVFRTDSGSFAWIADSKLLPLNATCQSLLKLLPSIALIAQHAQKQNLTANEFWLLCAERALACAASAEALHLSVSALLFCPENGAVMADTSPGVNKLDLLNKFHVYCPPEHYQFFNQLRRCSTMAEAYKQLQAYIQHGTTPLPGQPYPAPRYQQAPGIQTVPTINPQTAPATQPVPGAQPRTAPVTPVIPVAQPKAQPAPAPRESLPQKLGAGVGKIVGGLFGGGKTAPASAPQAATPPAPAPRRAPAPAYQSVPAPAHQSAPVPKPAAPQWPATAYRLRQLPEVGDACPAIQISTRKEVIIQRHDLAREKELYHLLQSSQNHQMKHPVPATQGLCLLQEVNAKADPRSFFVVRDAIDVNGWLPVGHPELLALPLADQLTIARNMAAIFAHVVEAGWLPTRIFESNMLINPADKSVCFRDGYLLSHTPGAPLSCTLGYAAPENAGKENAVADLPQVSYALAVWLYRLFIGGYPLEGRKTMQALQASGKPEADMAVQLYGDSARFCFDPCDDSNSLSGLNGRYIAQMQRWVNAPRPLQLLWNSTFVACLHRKIHDRPTPAMWLETIRNLQ